MLRHREVIATSKELALALAGAAKKIRGRVRSILRYEDRSGEMRKLQRAFQQALIHDLTDDDFGDMLAQTVTYGLFSVSVRRTFPGEGTAVTREDAPHLIFTSPFLKEMMSTFLGLNSRKGKIDFDELGIADVTDILQSPDTHMEAVLRDFGNKTRGEDPVIHFYERFLTGYDKQKKIQRGVFYTPQPVVSYIVRSVHELLQTEFGLEDGLASTVTWGEMIGGDALPRVPNIPAEPPAQTKDGAAQQGGPTGLRLPPLTDEPGEKRTISPDEPFVQILAPATGTATFLVEVIEVIHRHLGAKWNKGGFAAMPALPGTAAPAAPEISRGSSEHNERTPPVKDKNRMHPGGVAESPARATVPAPLRGADAVGMGSGGIAAAQPPANVPQPSAHLRRLLERLHPARPPPAPPRLRADDGPLRHAARNIVGQSDVEPVFSVAQDINLVIHGARKPAHWRERAFQIGCGGWI